MPTLPAPSDSTPSSKFRPSRLYRRLLFLILFLITPLLADANTYLDPDALWRPREWLIFHLQDAQGDGFALDLTVRDMNTYLQGPRPVMVWVVGPRDQTLVRHILEDDGIVAGDEAHRDGIYDPYADFRYREWHRVHSPGGYPPGKTRSPYLENPQQLPARDLHLDIPAAGPGLYRVVIVASWDHWISLTADRPIPAGVHPGPGPLYVHGDRLRETYFYLPKTTAHIGLMTTEEIEPYNWKMELATESGRALDSTSARTFATYMTHAPEEKDAVYRLSLSGNTTGACLHGLGFPFILCPDPKTARLIHGGIEVDAKGRPSLHHHQRQLDAWADALTPEDLEVAILPGDAVLQQDREKIGLDEVPELLASQNLDPDSPDYGRFADRTAPDKLALLAGLEDSANPYHGHPGLVRRVLLARTHDLRRLSPFFWYNTRDLTYRYRPPTGYTTAPQRSGWYGLGLDSRHARSLLLMKDIVDDALPSAVVDAWKRAFELWTGGRWMMHVGEVANQWTYNLRQIQQIWQITEDPELVEMMRRHIRTLTTPGLMGRHNPDPLPFDGRHSLGYTGDVDLGLTPSGYMAEQMGFDCQYTIEQVHNAGIVWRQIQEPSVLDWWNTFYYLKTHLTLTKDGRHTSEPFNGSCSPTDLNFRTRYYTHKTGLPAEARDRVVYGDLWGGTEQPHQPWPCLEEGSFVRSVDSKFHCVKTPAYYAICYAGPRLPAWSQFTSAVVEDGSISLEGYGGPGYGAFGRSTTKVGALSALFVPGCGPVLLAQNQNIADANVVWGRTRDPILPSWQKGMVDPRVVSSAYVQPHAKFDPERKTYHLREELRYAPLVVERTLHFRDDRIVVDLELLATDDLDLAELYHAIPYFADNRIARTFGKDLTEEKPFAIPDPILIAGKTPQPELEATRYDLEPVTFRAIDFSSENGAGATLIFDRTHTFAQAAPMRYRHEAASGGSLNLTLPSRLQSGERHTLRYAIYAHPEAVTIEQLRRIADEEGLH